MSNPNETQGDTGSDIPHRLMRMLSTLLRMGGLFTQFVEARKASVRATWRRELRRSASVLLYALVGAFFICAAATWGAAALLMAFWETHRVLVASLLAGGFALLAVIVLLLLRRDTR